MSAPRVQVFRPSRAVKLTLLCSGVVALGALLASYTGTRADLAALQKKGVPLSEAAADRINPLAADNAALTYMEANERLRPMQMRNGQFQGIGLEEFFGTPVSDFSHPRILHSVPAMQPIVDLFRKGATMSRCVLAPADPAPAPAPGEEDLRFDAGLRGYSQFSQVTSTLCGMAQAEMLQGKTVAALSDMKLAQNVAVQFSRNPGSESFRQWASESRAFQRNWLGMVKIYGNDRGVLMAASEMAHVPGPMGNIKEAAAGDFPGMLAIYQTAQKDPFSYKVHRRGRSDSDETDNSILMRQAVNQAIHEWRRVFEAMPSDPNDWQGMKAAFQMGSDEMKTRWPASALLEDSFRNYSFLCNMWAYDLATRRLAVVSSNILMDRMNHKAIPDTLPNYADDSIDPFTGQPFGYKKAGNGFVVYSMGIDGVDNRLAPPQRGKPVDDIVYDFRD